MKIVRGCGCLEMLGFGLGRVRSLFCAPLMGIDQVEYGVQKSEHTLRDLIGLY